MLQAMGINIQGLSPGYAVGDIRSKNKFRQTVLMIICLSDKKGNPDLSIRLYPFCCLPICAGCKRRIGAVLRFFLLLMHFLSLPFFCVCGIIKPRIFIVFPASKCIL